VGTHNPLFYQFGPQRIINPNPPQPTKLIESSQIEEDSLYWEKDDVNPNMVIYDLEKDKVIIPQSEDEVVVTPLPEQDVKKFVIKNVGNTRYRNNR
jgi:hypothetical protein